MTGHTWFAVATAFFGGMGLYYLYIALFMSYSPNYLLAAALGLLLAYYSNETRKQIAS